MSTTPQLRLWALCSGPGGRGPDEYPPPWAATAAEIFARLEAASRAGPASALLRRAAALDYKQCMAALRAGSLELHRVAFDIRGLALAAADCPPAGDEPPAPKTAQPAGGLPLVYDTI